MVEWLKTWLYRSPIYSIGLAATIMAVAGIVSRLLGFVRDRLLAASFGAGDTLDAYYAAFRLPDTLFELLILGALSAAFIPVFTSFMTRGQEDFARRMAGGVLSVVLVILAVLAIILWVVAPSVIPLLVPGFTPDKAAMVVAFTRIMLISPILLGASAVFGSVLMSLQRFAVYALAPIFYNGGIIIGILFLVPILGIDGLAWGVVLGALLHLLITMSAALWCGFGSVTWPWHALRDVGVRNVITLMIPRVIGTATGQISMIGVTFFASLTAAGGLAAFTLANNVASIPIGVIGIPFAVAAFPTLSAYAARHDSDAFVILLVKYIRRTLFLVLPLAMLLIVLRAQTVRVVFGTGAFDWEDTVTTFQILGIIAAAIFALALIPLLARAFYAMHDTQTPLIAGLLGIAVTMMVTWVLLPILDIYAIAWGFTAGIIVNFVLLFILLERKLRHEMLTQVHNAVLGVITAIIIATTIVAMMMWLERMSLSDIPPLVFIGFSAIWLGLFTFTAMLLRVDRFFVRVLSMTVLAAIAVQVVKYIVGTVTDLSTFGEVLMQLLLAGSVGIGTYLYLAHVLLIDEFLVLRGHVLSMIIRRNLQ